MSKKIIFTNECLGDFCKTINSMGDKVISIEANHTEERLELTVKVEFQGEIVERYFSFQLHS